MYVFLSLLLPTLIFAASVYSLLTQRSEEELRNTTAPVTYVDFLIDGQEPVRDMEVDHVWVRVPRPSESANAIFASNQFYFQRGHGGYMGTQVWVRKPGKQFSYWLAGAVTHKVIFSIWDGSPSHKALPGLDAVSLRNCKRFGGEGTGAHCSITYPLQLRTKVTVRMEHGGRSQDGQSDIWRGFVKNPYTKETLPLGSILVPDLDGDGFGLLEPYRSGTAFQEYWKTTGCENQALSQVGLYGPYFKERTLLPSRADPRYKRGCSHEEVSACIPGDDVCGKPRVLLSAGGTITATAKEGFDLWAQSPKSKTV